MLKNLSNYFDDFIIDRITDIDEQVIRNDREVENLKKECNDLIRKIIKSLPKEDRSLIFSYEEKINEADIQYFKIIYKQGFIDGVKTVNMVNEV
ncbi:hypothetical protein R9X47_04500 [Wukongibacter baidiensis]|uniref:hypothetical protein n=1 Tax=Wukongibacter baidiensis TaxID=1723361 RepID=UPI003D7FA4C9